MAINRSDLNVLWHRVVGTLADAWTTVVSPPRDSATDAAIVERASRCAPVVWLIGKVQSGKSVRRRGILTPLEG